MRRFLLIKAITHLTGYPDGEPAGKTGRIDILCAMTSAFAILAALNFRERTGKGQHVDMSSTESMTVLISDTILDYTMNP